MKLNRAAWRVYDEDDADTTPPDSGYVWVFDEREEAVTIGFFDEWWRTTDGGDDINVSHWAPLPYPEPPKGTGS